MLVLSFDDMRSNPWNNLVRILHHIGVDPVKIIPFKEEITKKVNVIAESNIPANLREHLYNFYANDIEEMISFFAQPEFGMDLSR